MRATAIQANQAKAIQQAVNKAHAAALAGIKGNEVQQEIESEVLEMLADIGLPDASVVWIPNCAQEYEVLSHEKLADPDDEDTHGEGLVYVNWHGAHAILACERFGDESDVRDGARFNFSMPVNGAKRYLFSEGDEGKFERDTSWQQLLSHMLSQLKAADRSFTLTLEVNGQSGQHIATQLFQIANSIRKLGINLSEESIGKAIGTPHQVLSKDR